MKKGARIAIILVVVFVVISAGGFFGYTRLSGEEGEGPGLGFLSFRPQPGGPRPGGPQGEPQEKYSVPVAVAAARQENVRETLTLYGSVAAEREVSIVTTVNGKVSQIKVEEGDFVAKDQVLAIIDRDQAGLKFSPVEVESTIPGVVKSVLIQEGATANPGVPLFQIVDMDVVEVVVDVPEKRIARVRIGQPVEISVISYPDRVFTGTIDRLSPVVDPASRSLETRIRVVNRAYQLKPGMFAEAEIILGRRDEAVTVPLAALVDKEGRQVAFVVEQGVAREVEPVVAFVQGERAVVDSGLTAGELLVVIGQQSLSGGDAVTVAEVKE
jgi:multidrug efflux pump subunit AcrA (membrane-fusion protein)